MWFKIDIATKRDKEKQMVSQMIALYCKKKHHTKHTLCNECQALEDYARQRVNKCPFMEDKTFCSSCKVHCYKSDKREQIREVMRFAGPWMLLYHPIITIRHGLDTLKEKRKLKEQIKTREE